MAARLGPTSFVAYRTEIACGELIRVLDGQALPAIDVHTVFPAGRHPPAKARAFADRLAAMLA